MAKGNPTSTKFEDMWQEMERSVGKDERNAFKLPVESVPGEASAEKAAQLEKEFESKIQGIMKEKGDKFDEMIQHDAKIALGEDGYKERYYKEKFPNHRNWQEVRDGMVKSYVEGLCWVMGYYYDGVPSWRWYYPYHYAPFTSDLCQMSHIEPLFELAEPFDPIQQLMAVLPAGSRHSLPKPLQDLFVSRDSPIKDFYPVDFKQDMNGKRFQWQAVALLPFIDETRLVKAMAPLLSKLTPEEKDRNTAKLQKLYLHSSHSLMPAVQKMAQALKDVPLEQRREAAMSPKDAKACEVDEGDIPPEQPLWHEKDRMRRQGRPRDAPYLGDAARRHIRHNLDRRAVQQGSPDPNRIPQSVTLLAERMCKLNVPPMPSVDEAGHGLPPGGIPSNVTACAIQLMMQQSQGQGWCPMPQFQAGVGSQGSVNAGFCHGAPGVMAGGPPVLNAGMPQHMYWDRAQLVNPHYAFFQHPYGNGFVDVGAGMNTHVDNNTTAPRHQLNSSEGRQRQAGGRQRNWQQNSNGHRMTL